MGICFHDFCNAMMNGIKPEVYALCLELIKDRIERAREAMNNAQEAANSEDKSSAGDKYETSRAMGQIDRDMFAKQLAEAEKDYVQFKSLNPQLISQEAGRGALVELENGYFYLAVGIGNVQMPWGKVVVISMNSPLASSLAGKKVGEYIDLNGKKLLIKSVE